MNRFSIAVVLLAAASGAARAQNFEPPVRLTAGGKPIDVDIGHAAPYLHDVDKDGRRDLLVGQFEGGKLRIYRNTGTEAAPAYGAFEWLTVDGEVVTTPVG